MTQLGHPVPGLLPLPGQPGDLAVVLDLQVLGSVRAGAGEDPGVYLNLTERQVVTSEN